ncbi:hypothetical protein BG000_011600, partial [Podila horticola]
MSKLFVALPSEFYYWNGLDPIPYPFRIYFLCDNWKHDEDLENLPQHVHFSNHPGYKLSRPHQFFEQYGDYVLRMLRMIKAGYTNSSYEIPPLNTSKILWNSNPEITGSHLTSETIGPLVDLAIQYLEELSPPKWTKLGLTRSQSAEIKSFLVAQEGDNAEGNLHRYISSAQFVCWRCPVHASQYLDSECLDQLKEFIHGRGGNIDMQQAAIRIDLRSTSEADQFLTLLTGVNHRFNISVNLDWEATQAYVKDFCLQFSKRKTVSLEIDGVTPLDNNPQAKEQYMFNPFAGCTKATELSPGLQFVKFVNYPLPQVYSVYFGQFSLQSKLSPARLAHSWADLQDDLKLFRDMVCSAQVASDCITAARVLQAVLWRHWHTDVTVVTTYGNSWSAVFDLKERMFVEVYSLHTACPKGVLYSGYLQRLTVDLGDLAFDQDFFRMVQINTALQELNVSYYGHSALYYAENII